MSEISEIQAGICALGYPLQKRDESLWKGFGGEGNAWLGR